MTDLDKNGWEAARAKFYNNQPTMDKALERAIQDYLDAAGHGIKIKALAWVCDNAKFMTRWKAETSVGWYVIEEQHKVHLGKYWMHVQLSQYQELHRFDTLDEARTAAQADYETRIRAAIIDAPVKIGEPFPQPDRNRAGKEPCGECHLRPGEICDVCGASDTAILAGEM